MRTHTLTAKALRGDQVSGGSRGDSCIRPACDVSCSLSGQFPTQFLVLRCMSVSAAAHDPSIQPGGLIVLNLLYLGFISYVMLFALSQVHKHAQPFCVQSTPELFWATRKRRITP